MDMMTEGQAGLDARGFLELLHRSITENNLPPGTPMYFQASDSVDDSHLAVCKTEPEGNLALVFRFYKGVFLPRGLMVDTLPDEGVG